MRLSNMCLIAVICAPLVSACAAPSALSGQAANGVGDACPSLEGYPDCQDGHRVDLAHLTADPGEDRASIHDLQARYELALDSGDAGAYAALFTKDGVLEAPGDVARGRDAIAGSLRVATRRVVTNVVIRLDGDKATSTASWIEVDDKNPGRHAQLGPIGRYEDQFIKSRGTWLFARRKVVMS
jgi:ketosteroid isomerase-like protein